MKLKTRSILVSAAAAAVAIVPFAPARAGVPVFSPVQTDVAYAIDGSHVAIGTCTGAGATTDGRTMTVAWAGTAKATGAIAVGVRCGVVQDGVVVAESSHALPGPVGATAGTAVVELKEYEMCANVFAVFPDGRVVRQENCSS